MGPRNRHSVPSSMIWPLSALSIPVMIFSSVPSTSSKLAGDIFLVPKAAFEGVMSKPAYFNP